MMRSHWGGRCLSATLLILPSLVTATLAIAQDASLPEEQHSATDIYIQGVPFSEPLKEVPQSTTVITQEQIQQRGALFFQNTMESVPGLTWSGGTSQPRFFLIRGVGELEQYEGAPNPSVATIVDDVDMSGLGVAVPLFDINQVEVLRGPQGVRFGSSALGGAINMRSDDPTPYTTGHVQLTAGNDELGAGGAAVGGSVPGTDGKLQLRFSAFKSDSNGFRNNVYLSRDDTNHRDDGIARLKLRYQANPDLTVDWSGWMVNADDGFDAFAIDNSRTTQSDKPGEDSLWVRASAMKTTLRLSPDVRAQNIVTAMRAHQDYSFDGDWGNNPFWGQYAPYDYYSASGRTRRTYSEELRFFNEPSTYVHGESLRWIGGGFLQRLTEDTAIRNYSNEEEYESIVTDYEAKTAAGFGQVEIPLGARTSISPGVRLEYRDTSFSDSRGESFDPNFTMLGGSVSLEHDITDDVRGYITVARGFKGGGYNAGPSVPTDLRQYDPEYLYNFEGGIKGAFLERRLVSNVSVFNELRRDQQLKFAVQDNPSDPLSYTFITQSAARGRSTGIEFENTYSLLDWWSIFGSGSVMDTEFTSVPDEVQDLEGRAFSHAPTWQYSVGTKAEVASGLMVRTEVTGKDRFYFDDSNNQQSKPYYLWNASVMYRFEGWSITAWGRNLLNETYAVRGFYFGNEPPDYPNKLYVQQGDPRAVGVTVAYAF